jgi:hypothetical protein
MLTNALGELRQFSRRELRARLIWVWFDLAERNLQRACARSAHGTRRLWDQCAEASPETGGLLRHAPPLLLAGAYRGSVEHPGIKFCCSLRI